VLQAISVPRPLFRVARTPVWDWPDWAFAGRDGTFGNRYDDPESEYRVLYASATRYGCFIETLARYRPDLELYAELATIDGPDDYVPQGVVPASWLRERWIGEAHATGTHADVGSSPWIAYLRTKLPGDVLGANRDDFDASVLYLSAPRALTQAVSRIAFREGFDGIRYLSKYGHDIVHCAVFEGRVFFSDEAESRIAWNDEELHRALRVHHLRLEDAGAVERSEA